MLNIYHIFPSLVILTQMQLKCIFIFLTLSLVLGVLTVSAQGQFHALIYFISSTGIQISTSMNIKAFFNFLLWPCTKSTLIM